MKHIGQNPALLVQYFSISKKSILCTDGSFRAIAKNLSHKMVTNQSRVMEFEPLKMSYRKLAEEAPQNARSFGGTLRKTSMVGRAGLSVPNQTPALLVQGGLVFHPLISNP